MPQDLEGGSQQFRVKTVSVESEEIHDFQVPTFVNSSNVWRHGHDVYVDMQLITVEQVGALKPGAEVTIAVYERFVMNPLALNDLAKKINLVREQLKAEGLLRDE